MRNMYNVTHLFRLVNDVLQQSPAYRHICGEQPFFRAISRRVILYLCQKSIFSRIHKQPQYDKSSVALQGYI